MPSWVSWVSCHRAIMTSWSEFFILCVFGVSKFFSHGYFVGPTFFLVGISWVQHFSREYFGGLRELREADVDPSKKNVRCDFIR